MIFAAGLRQRAFASFEDPDGNGYLLQEIKMRLPGREWKSTEAGRIDIGKLAELLHETEQHHGNYEKAHAKHNWWDWYALSQRALERQASGGISDRR